MKQERIIQSKLNFVFDTIFTIVLLLVITALSVSIIWFLFISDNSISDDVFKIVLSSGGLGSFFGIYIKWRQKEHDFAKSNT